MYNDWITVPCTSEELKSATAKGYKLMGMCEGEYLMARRSNL